MKDKLFKIGLYPALVLLAIMAVVVFYWNVQPTDVIKPNNAPYPVRPIKVDPGGVEVVTVDYCKLQSKNGSVQIRFVGKKSMTTTVRYPERQTKGCNKANIPILLPAQLVHDTFYIEFNSIYKINPITTVTEVSKSQDFTIR